MDAKLEMNEQVPLPITGYMSLTTLESLQKRTFIKANTIDNTQISVRDDSRQRFTLVAAQDLQRVLLPDRYYSANFHFSAWVGVAIERHKNNQNNYFILKYVMTAVLIYKSPIRRKKGYLIAVIHFCVLLTSSYLISHVKIAHFYLIIISMT